MGRRRKSLVSKMAKAYIDSAMKAPRYDSHRRNQRTEGYYVYAWYQSAQHYQTSPQTPLYIGKGKGNRAFRAESRPYYVVILQDRMHEREALAVEAPDSSTCTEPGTGWIE